MTHGADLSEEADPPAPGPSWQPKCRYAGMQDVLPSQGGAAQAWPLLPLLGDRKLELAAAGREQKRTEGIQQCPQVFYYGLETLHPLAHQCQSEASSAGT